MLAPTPGRRCLGASGRVSEASRENLAPYTPRVAVCPSCGAETPLGAAFCPSCGSALLGSSGAARTEERRVVSVLFVDLVGFTKRSDRADPEDVRRTLVPFHTRVKGDIERFGGTLDKFMGDAAMGVFGAPIAHEDDPVRAVRAALRILESMEDLRRTDPELAVRVAVDTGEAVVAFGSGPQVGEAVAGDVVNTVSRMQSLAPEGSVVVGEMTAGRLQDLFRLEEMPPASVKGKAEPLRLWRVLGEGRTADVPGPLVPMFVGRREELRVLEEAFEEVRRTGSTRTITLVGEPGIGKSRLVQALVERLPGSARRLTGWCLPYGEGATFAPVAETLHALADVAAADGPQAVADAIARHARRVGGDDSERRWLSSRLGTVLGLGAAEGDATVPAEEIADAWARVLVHAIGEEPLVLIIEDLHWAEATFVETLRLTVERVASRPVLVLVSARPDLHDRHPGWATGTRGSGSIELAPLEDEDAEEIVSTLLKEVDLTSSVRKELLERAAGNPLYALEYARLLGDRPEGGGGPVGTPETLRDLIAARLDTVPSDLRSTASDASVIGDEFWASIIAQLGRRAEAEAREALGALVGRGLAEPWETSSLDEPAYGFSHALIREVAYSRLPRSDRARRHLSAGLSIEERTGERASEHADLLARHFSTAFELASATGEGPIADEARDPAFRWSMTAADRAASVDANRAFDLYDRAVTFAAAGRDRFAPLIRSAILGRRSGRLDADAVLGRLEDALAVARAAGDELLIGEALTRVGSQLGALGQTARSRETLAAAVRVLEEWPPGRALAGAYAYRAEEEMFAGHVRESSELAGRAIAILEDAPDELVIMALHIRGDARCSEGDPGGIDDLREALRLSEEEQSTTDIVTSRNYLGEWLAALEGPAAAMREFEAAIALAERRGFRTAAQWAKATAAVTLFDLGDWDRALVLCEELLAVPEGMLDATLSVQARVTRSGVHLARGAGVVDDPDQVLALARNVEELQALVPALVMGASVAAFRGDRATARSLLEAFDSATQGVAQEYRGSKLAEVARTSVAVGAEDLLERIISTTEARSPRDSLQLQTATAVLAEGRGDEDAAERYRIAADGWRSFGVPYEEALARMGRARAIGDVGDAPDPDDESRTRDLLTALGVSVPSRSSHASGTS
jgi:class 3 adenylate cyclase/tetratricopeptide (TPR) repeat protein